MIRAMFTFKRSTTWTTTLLVTLLVIGFSIFAQNHMTTAAADEETSWYHFKDTVISHSFCSKQTVSRDGLLNI